MKYLIPVLLLTLAVSCGTKPRDKAIEEISKLELEFCKMSMDSGIAKAFVAYADSNATIKRGDSLIIGLRNVKEYYKKRIPRDNEKLLWLPDYVDASQSGDMGYTYGKYRFAYTDSVGNNVELAGVFHTVWKKNKQGEWKFVWD